MPIDEARAFFPVRIAVLKVDNRSRAEDAAGDLLVQRLVEAGHELGDRDRLGPDLEVITERLRQWVADPSIDCVIVTGGTGLTQQDVVPEALASIWDREIPGFGELFRSLSVNTVGTSALQSRACAGVASGTCLFAVPGSPGGAGDAWDGILAAQLDSRHRPCSLVELMPYAQRRRAVPHAVGND
jgi:molybdenum cofactor biosynthesis protein B